jgi:hypothetical protein
MGAIPSRADTLAGSMPGHHAQDILSDENWDDWPDLELFDEDPELNLDPDDDPETA